MISAEQEQVPAGTTSIVLRNLTPDTPYTVSVLPVYPAREGKRQSENGKTRTLPHQSLCASHVLCFRASADLVSVVPVPLGGVGNMKVTNPTMTTLTVTWNPADGNVQGYKVISVPVDGGQEIVVRKPTTDNGRLPL